MKDMQCRVIRPFRWNGHVRMPGQIVEMDVAQAGRMRSMGLVGQVEQAGPPRERAVKGPSERRANPRKKQQEVVADNQEIVEEDEA